MKIYAPTYYKKFKCIAGECKHTCCAGWEVDIDEDSLKRFMEVSGEFGERIRANISLEDTPHFVLKEGDICPFLNGDNLCDMILTLGGDSVCQICADHPRFRNFWNDRVEIGLGMACEEAARIILSEKEPMKLEIIGEEEGPADIPADEQYLMDVRAELLAGITTGELFGFALEGPLARLAEYLIYRHIADALYDDKLDERIVFVVNSFREISDAWTDGNIETLVELCRAFSVKVEYNPEEQERRMKC